VAARPLDGGVAALRLVRARGGGRRGRRELDLSWFSSDGHGGAATWEVWPSPVRQRCALTVTARDGSSRPHRRRRWRALLALSLDGCRWSWPAMAGRMALAQIWALWA
jgi:hypothetical protein